MKKYFILATLLFLTACEVPDTAARRAALHLPPAGFIGDAAQGSKLFVAYCSSCHGNSAQGSAQGPPLISKVYRIKHHADLAVHMAVRDGVHQHHWNFGDMEAIPTINPEQTAHVIAYIRIEQSKAGINE